MGIKKRKSRKGFTVIEAIISLVLFTLVMIPLGSFTLTAIKTSVKSSNKEDAINLAQSMVEQIKAVNGNEMNSLDKKNTIDLGSDITITKEFNSEKNFKYYKIKGSKNDFDVEGTITPDLNYNISSSNANNKQIDFNYYVYAGDDYIEVYNKPKTDKSVAPLSRYLFNSAGNKKAVSLDIDKSSSGSVTIKCDNKILLNNALSTGESKFKILYEGKKLEVINILFNNQDENNTLSVYCYKNQESTLSYKPDNGRNNNSSGVVRIYKNLFELSTNELDSYLYNVDIDIKKKDELIYEIKATKAIKE